MLESQMATGKLHILLQKLRSLYQDYHFVQKVGAMEEPEERLEHPSRNVLSHGPAPQVRFSLKCQI